jgi:phosphoglycerate kinase
MNPITSLDNQNIEGKVALVRVDYNVPIQNGVITDDFRIRSSLRTIEYLREKGAKVVLISHIEGKGAASLEAVAEYDFPFAVTFEKEIPAADNVTLKAQLADFSGANGSDGNVASRLRTAPNGSVFLFENLRNNLGEKDNDPEFAAALASVADFFVGDAFSVSHRKHASIVGIPALLPHYAGFQILDEVSHLEKGLNPNHPFIFILGGAKFDTKLPLIQKFMAKADKVLIGGALFNDIMKGRGLEIGTSLVSNAVLPDEILRDPEQKLIPIEDVIVKNTGKGSDAGAGAGEILTKKVDAVSPDESVLDAGPSVIQEIKVMLDDAKAAGQKPFVLWNGPLGNYEEGFKDQTVALARLIIDSGVDALIGGGDTTAAISHIKESSPNVYVSTGGGAMIDYLIDETLVGIEALK